MTQKTYTDCGCEITVYGDGSAPPEIEYCDLHDAAREMRDVLWDVLIAPVSDALRERARTILAKSYSARPEKIFKSTSDANINDPDAVGGC